MNVRRLLRVAAIAAFAAALILALLTWGVHRATQHVPDFYQQALVNEPEQQEAAGDQLERHVLQLHNEARRAGQWQAVFTDEHINGWLAVDLPEKFPGILPKTLQDPRVAVTPEAVRIAFRYEDGQFSTVVSLEVEAHLTDEPNVLALRIRKARAGLLPVPLKKVLDAIQTAAREADLMLHWAQQEGDPVALVTLPTEHKEYRRRALSLKAVELRRGEIVVAGRTNDESRSGRLVDAQPIATDQSGEKKTRQR
jgi:hypothetical protein